jgi:hypothetical protein
LPRCERADHYTEWIRACKAGKKSITPIEFGCDLTEFALLGSAALRRYSTPGLGESTGERPGAGGDSGRSDSAVVWIPASNDGHMHDPNARPLANNGTRATYWRSSKVLLWDSKGMKFSNDAVAQGYVDMPYRKEWDYKV